jgi:redox-sensing transcriptional repressor
MNKTIAPVPTIRRIPGYLHVLQEFKKQGKEFISATDIAGKLDLKPIQVRKDMAFTGIIGKPRVGYQVENLMESIRSFLDWNHQTPAVLMGAGALGSALLGYKNFEEHGIRIVAAFDEDKAKIGKKIHGREVFSIERVKDMVIKHEVIMGIITVPPEGAQRAADSLLNAGVKGIWNFSPQKVEVPEHVIVQHEDLSSSLAVLSVRLKGGEAEET